MAAAGPSGEPAPKAAEVDPSSSASPTADGDGGWLVRGTNTRFKSAWLLHCNTSVSPKVSVDDRGASGTLSTDVCDLPCFGGDPRCYLVLQEIVRFVFFANG